MQIITIFRGASNYVQVQFTLNKTKSAFNHPALQMQASDREKHQLAL